MKKLLVGAAAVALCAGAVWMHSPAHITGVARVIDGDTIVINDVHVRLAFIDAPERRQTCEGKNGDVYECGRDAAAVMSELTRGRQVECEPTDRDRYGRTVAVCRTEAVELNAEMVRRGWAVDEARYDRAGRYRAAEEEARAAHLGIWSGRFTMPAAWRQEHRR